MKNNAILWGVVILVVLVLGGYFFLNRGPSTTSNNSSSQNQKTNQVSIASYSFQPANITVKVGTTVTWTNNDSPTHHVQSDSGAFDLGEVAPGNTSSFVFEKTGSFPYHCAIHPSMTGTVTVTAN